MTEFERELAACLQPARCPESIWYRVEASLRRPTKSRSSVLPGLLAAASLAAVGYFEHPISNLASNAREVHLDLVRHPAHLELGKCQPAQLHDWMARRTGLALTLAARPQPDPQHVEIVGARSLEDGRAAVLYRVAGYPVTLLLGRAAGKHERSQKNIATRQESRGQVTLFTWEAHGQQYTLVSSLPGNSRQACVICHV